MAGMRMRIAAAALCAVFLLFAAALTAGCGEARVAIPDLSGMNAQEAEEALLESGLELGEIGEEFSDTAPPGSVIATAPEIGTEVGKGARVDLTISRGPENVTVPMLLGMDERQAVESLRGLGFQAEIRKAYSEEFPEGCVCAMEPAPESVVPYGSTVAVTLSQGSAYVACPDCGGDGRIAQATACSDCGGDGYLATTTTCPECGGSGVCPT